MYPLDVTEISPVVADLAYHKEKQQIALRFVDADECRGVLIWQTRNDLQQLAKSIENTLRLFDDAETN